MCAIHFVAALSRAVVTLIAGHENYPCIIVDLYLVWSLLFLGETYIAKSLEERVRSMKAKGAPRG
jgi:hypothetical protein